jgi:hypothetical protein
MSVEVGQAPPEESGVGLMGGWVCSYLRKGIRREDKEREGREEMNRKERGGAKGYQTREGEGDGGKGGGMNRRGGERGAEGYEMNRRREGGK